MEELLVEEAVSFVADGEVAVATPLAESGVFCVVSLKYKFIAKIEFFGYSWGSRVLSPLNGNGIGKIQNEAETQKNKKLHFNEI